MVKEGIPAGQRDPGTKPGGNHPIGPRRLTALRRMATCGRRLPQDRINGRVETVGLFGLPETAPGLYEGALPPLFPLHGIAIFTFYYECPAGSKNVEVVPFTIYIDPSGTVVDGNHGDAPLASATVTLLSLGKP